MATKIKTRDEFYAEYRDEVLGLADELTDFSEGSMHDIIAGAIATGQNEISELIITEFSKTFFALANGTEAQGGKGDVDDLNNLAVDNFGDSFARPEAVASTGQALFSRPNTGNGDVLIALGSIVKTEKDPNGEEIRFKTTEEVTLTGLSIYINIEAVDPGVDGNITSINKIIVLESTLTDPTVTVTNDANTAGGIAELQDAEYRDFIQNKIVALAGATEAAVKGAALSTPGVATAVLTTVERVVIDYDIGGEEILAGAKFFRIPYPIMYIADALGNSSPALIQAVKDSILETRGAGVRIEVLGAISVPFNWSASLTLNAGGPNFAELSADLSMIIDSMTEYVNTVIETGGAFNRSMANTHILSIWGPDGTNDLTNFSTSIPSGNVAVEQNEKLIANIIQIV